jgi:hypothetical protein
MIMDSSEPSAVQQIRDVVALRASLVGLIYVSGVLIVGLRLAFERLPPFAAVGSIPKETAITIGLVQVFAPAVLLTAAPGFVFSLWTYDGLQGSHWTLIAPIVIGWFVTALYVHLRARIRERGDSETWKSQSSMLLRAGLFALATVPMIITVASAVRLPTARVCFKPNAAWQSHPTTGLFVTQTDNRIYIGDLGEGARRLHALSSSIVAQVSVGENAAATPCRLTRSPTTGG